MNSKSKLTIWAIAIIVIICLLYYNFYGLLFSPGRSFGRGFALLTYEKKARFDLCHYNIPEGFSLIKYMGSGKTKNYGLLILENDTTKQNILLVQIPELTKIDLNLIETNDKPLKKTKSYSMQPINDTFKVCFYMPRIFTRRFINDGSLILRGIDVTNKEAIENERTISTVWKGKFKELALDKENKSIFRNISTVFCFNGEKTGAVAVVNDKSTGNSLIVITDIAEKKELNFKPFKEFIESIDFDTVVFDPYRVLKEKGIKYEEF